MAYIIIYIWHVNIFITIIYFYIYIYILYAIIYSTGLHVYDWPHSIYKQSWGILSWKLFTMEMIAGHLCGYFKQSGTFQTYRLFRRGGLSQQTISSATWPRWSLWCQDGGSSCHSWLRKSTSLTYKMIEKTWIFLAANMGYQGKIVPNPEENSWANPCNGGAKTGNKLIGTLTHLRRALTLNCQSGRTLLAPWHCCVKVW